MTFNNISTAHVKDILLDNITTEFVPREAELNSSGENHIRDADLHNSVDISKDTAADVTFALECIVMPILVTFGITGNVLSLIVLCQRKLRTSSTTILLIGLAISDCLYLVTIMIRKSTCIISRINEVTSNRFFVFSFSAIFYINTCFSRVSTLLVAVISIERFLAVTLPFKVKLYFTKTKTTIVVVTCYLITFAILAVLATQLEVKTIQSTPFLLYSNFYKNNKELLDIYNKYVTISVLRWLPKIIVVTCNTVIIIYLWRRRRPSDNPNNARTMSNHIYNQRRITIMLVTVAVVFVVALLPGDAFWIANLVVDGFGHTGRYKNMFMVFSDVIVVFEIINSSVNFVIYMVLNKTFSDIYIALFCPRLLKTRRLVRALSN